MNYVWTVRFVGFVRSKISNFGMNIKLDYIEMLNSNNSEILVVDIILFNGCGDVQTKPNFINLFIIEC